MGIRFYTAFMVAACCVSASFCADDEVITGLTKDMSSFAKTATDTRQNIDYLPFIVSVWDGEKLSKLGIRTLKDALMLSPGVDVSTDNVNNKSPIFRGSNPFAYGQSRLVVDGVVVNDRVFDGYSTYLDMPIEIIKRIEIVRGPGSFAEEANGYAGTIKVVTYAEDGSKNGGKGYVMAGTQSSYSGGALYNTKFGEWQFHTDFYYYKDDANIKINGKDGLSYSAVNSALSQSGYAPTNLNTYSLAASISNGEFSFSGRSTYYETGSAFGNFYSLPRDTDKQNMPSWNIEAKYDKQVVPDVELELKTGYMEDGWESDARTYPSGMQVGAVTFPDGYLAKLEIRNRIVYGGVAVTFDGFENHTIKAGVQLNDEKNIDVRSVTTNKLTGIGWVDYSDSTPFFDGNAAKRKTTKLFLSDFYDFSDELAFSYGVSSNKATDFDRQNDYRAAAVWQPSTRDILKFMTSTAYRAPAWQELYGMNNPVRIGNRSLKPERVRAYETQYIRKLGCESSASANLFYLQNKDQINKINAQNEYRNAQNSTIYGAELNTSVILRADSPILATHI